MGFLPSFLLKRLVSTEFDLAGVVVDGNGTDLKEGDEVFGWIPLSESSAAHPLYVFLTPLLRMRTDQNLSTGQGALSQYTRLPAVNVVLRPKNVTPTEASGFTVAGLTAYQALFDLAKLEAGQSVFVNGGSTAVGSFAIQIAKAKGAHVAASASAKNEQYVRGLGADEVRAGDLAGGGCAGC